MSLRLGIAVGCAGLAVAFFRRLSFSPLLWIVGSPFIVVFAVGMDLLLTRWVETAVRARDKGNGNGTRNQRRGPIPLNFTSPAAWYATTTTWESPPPKPSANSDPLATAISNLLSLVLRDFINKWYTTISDSPSFPLAVERTIQETILKISQRVDKIDWSEVIVAQILPVVTTHMETFRTAELGLRGQDLKTQLTESAELDLFLSGRYASDSREGKLHPAVDVTSPNSRPAEEAFLSGIIGRMLPFILPQRELESGVVRVLTREIIARTVLLPVVDMLSDPDFWNKLIEQKAGAAIHDQQLVDKFREELDKQATPSRKTSTKIKKPNRHAEEISVRTTPKQFEAFVKGIGKYSLLNARRLRSDVTGQIRKARAMVAARSAEETGEGQNVSELTDFIERLYLAKRRADQRIAELGGQESRNRLSVPYDVATRPTISLRDVLLHPTSLSYFLEFQDRRNQSLKVQFWLLVEGLKDPLEDMDSDGESAALPQPSRATVATARSDLKTIWDVYFANDLLESRERYLEVVRNFLEKDHAVPTSARELRSARRAVFSIQQDVFDEILEDDYPLFVKSELYYKAVSDLPMASTVAGDEPTPFRLAVTEQPRPRGATHHALPLLRPSPLTSSRSPLSPPLPPSPAFSTTAFAPHVARNDNPQSKVPLSPVLYSASTADSLFDSLPPSRAHSINSSDAVPPNRKKSQPLSHSLDFLMTSPADRGRGRPLFVDPLFDDESEEEDETSPQETRFSDEDYVQVQAIEAIHDALSTILATDSKTTQRSMAKASENSSRSVSGESGPPRTSPIVQRILPARTTSSRSIFSGSKRESDELMVGEGKKRLGGKIGLGEGGEGMVDERHDDRLGTSLENVRLAAPGDLQLPFEIARIAAAIDKLTSQVAIVEALIRKAELTGTGTSGLKILIKSRDSLKRELRALSFQKAQYESQESENQLIPGRTSVCISGTTVGLAGREKFQLYLVEVRRIGLEGHLSSGWIVARRYSEFSVLHAKLKELFVSVRSLDLPGKKLVTSHKESFVEQRRLGLVQYLQALVKLPTVCQSKELRAFLSQENITLPQLDDLPRPTFPGQYLVRSLYKTISSGIDELLAGSNASSMMDTVIQRLSQQATAGVQDEDLVGQLEVREGPTEGMTYFTTPICDLFVTLFELGAKNNWLRRQAILIILQSILGGTIERKFRDATSVLTSPDALAGYVQMVQDGIWPDGQLKPSEPPRTVAQKLATKTSADRALSALIPDIAANLIGRANARQGARRLFAVLQNTRLNKQIIYTVFSELVDVVFPELALPPKTKATAFPPFVKSSI